jgi:hypothetical protein
MFYCLRFETVCVPFGPLYSTVGRTRRHLLEEFRFHNGCLRCLGNMFSFLGYTLILSLGIDCNGNKAY